MDRQEKRCCIWPKNTFFDLTLSGAFLGKPQQLVALIHGFFFNARWKTITLSFHVGRFTFAQRTKRNTASTTYMYTWESHLLQQLFFDVTMSVVSWVRISTRNSSTFTWCTCVFADDHNYTTADTKPSSSETHFALFTTPSQNQFFSHILERYELACCSNVRVVLFSACLMLMRSRRSIQKTI